MPYKTNQELPDSVQNVLPPHAQDIYRETFNSAHKEYQGHDETESALEERCHKVAWSAVKKKYKKVNKEGHWVQK